MIVTENMRIMLFSCSEVIPALSRDLLSEKQIGSFYNGWKWRTAVPSDDTWLKFKK